MSIALFRRRRGPIEPPPLVGPIITGPGSLSGTGFNAGTTRTITAGPSTPRGGGAVSNQYRWLVDSVVVATTAAYTLLAADAGDTVSAQWRAVEVGGTAAGETAWQEVGLGVIVIPVTDFAREFASGIGNVVIALSGVGPAESGTASYAAVGALPAWASLAGGNVTIDTGAAASGTLTLRRTDNNGVRDLRLTLTMVAWSLTRVGAGPDFEFVNGADDPGATTYALTLTGGPRDGQTISFTAAQIAALGVNAAHLAAVPVIGLTTDTDSDGALDTSDVATLAAAAVRVWRAGETVPASTYQWRDAAGAIAGATGTSYTGSGSEATTVLLRETVGAVFADSATVPVGGAGTGVTAATDGITIAAENVSADTSGVTVSEV